MVGGGANPLVSFWEAKRAGETEAEEPRAAEGPARAPQPIVRLMLRALLQRSPAQRGCVSPEARQPRPL